MFWLTATPRRSLNVERKSLPRRELSPLGRTGGNQGSSRSRTETGGSSFYARRQAAMNAIPMYLEGDNDLVLTEMGRVTRRYQYAKCVVYDRGSESMKDVSERKKALWRIRTCPADNFHGARNKDDCLENPYARPELVRRIDGVNTSVAKKKGSWARRYARSMNDL